jgi:hypothetical protein
VHATGCGTAVKFTSTWCLQTKMTIKFCMYVDFSRPTQVQMHIGEKIYLIFILKGFKF